MCCLLNKLTEFFFIIIVITIYHCYSSIKSIFLLKGFSHLMEYDFGRHNLYTAFVILKVVLIAALIFPHNVFFGSCVVIKFLSLTCFPRANLRDLNESMSVLHFEKDNLLFLLQNFARQFTYILNTKQIPINCFS